MKHTSKILLVASASLICFTGSAEARKATPREIIEYQKAAQAAQAAAAAAALAAQDSAFAHFAQATGLATMGNAPVAAMASETEEPQKKTSRPVSKNEEIILTVTSDGPTLDDALKNALRTAIEQAYGAFVSANTTILNDDIVKDEIVTVTNGSIKEYDIVSQYKKDNGTGYSVTANATVSLPHLITFAKNHGSECEFAGKTFAMEMKLFEIQKQNELKALYNLTDQIIQLSRTAMIYSLTVGEPRKPSDDDLDYYDEKALHCGVDAIQWAVNFTPYVKRHVSKYNTVRVSNELVGKVNIKAKNHLRQFKNKDEAASKYYIVPMTIEWKNNPDSEMSVRDMLNNYLKSLELNSEEIENFRNKGLDLGKFRGHILRNSQEKIDVWSDDLLTKLRKESNNFIIKDNTNTESTFYPHDIEERRQRVAEDKEKRYYIGSGKYVPNATSDRSPLMLDHISWCFSDNNPIFGIFGTGIFYNLFKFYHNPYYYAGYNEDCFDKDSSEEDYFPGYNKKSSEKDYSEWEIEVFIPTEEIDKYSKFWIERKEL